MPESKLTNRRDFGARILSSSSMVVAALASSQPAYADVSDGNALPQGAAQFGRVIRAKSDLQVRLQCFNNEIIRQYATYTLI
jgi:hypothetical protein